MSQEDVDHDKMMGCMKFVHDRLVKESYNRQSNDNWVEDELMVVVDSANLWAQRHGISRRISEDVARRLEKSALGHVDYMTKWALYVSEWMLGMRPS